jgi:hypothetical protein
MLIRNDSMSKLEFNQAYFTPRFGFPVPPGFIAFMTGLQSISASDPWTVLHTVGLDAAGTRCHPNFQDRGYDTADTPNEVVPFAYLRSSGAHYGFVVDDVPSKPQELPIAHVEPDGTPELLGLDFSEFLQAIVLETLSFLDNLGLGRESLEELVRVLNPSLNISMPEPLEFGVDWNGYTVPTELINLKRRVAVKRRRAGAIPTADTLGVMLPEETVDREYLESLTWPELDEVLEITPGDQVLDEAERRLLKGEVGTALVLARNFRFLFWYKDWKGERIYIKRTAEILAKAYGILGRSQSCGDCMEVGSKKSDFAFLSAS